MWLAIKEAAGKAKVPSLKLVQDQLGSTKDAILYRRLVGDHPEVERGPDETLSDHFSRLQRSQEDWRAEDTTDVKRRQRDPRAKPRVDEVAKTPAWATLKDALPRHEMLPGRNPGWFTSPESQSREFGVPPMARRTPGDALRPSHGPSYAPERQTVEQWNSWLADRGISLDPSGRRMSPADMALPQRLPRGHQIWEQFIDTSAPEEYGGRHRRAASAVVSSYVQGLLDDLEMPSKTAGNAHDSMMGQGWDFHESGSGNWYEKKIGDKIHRIVRQPDGWIHNFGPADGERDEFGDVAMGEYPTMFNDLGSAVLHANRGQIQIGFKPPPVGHQNLSSNSWIDEQ